MQDKSGNADPQGLLDKGLQVLAAGQEELAIKFFQKGVDVAPENTELLKTLGETLMEVGRVDDAKAAFRRCLEIDSSDYSLCMYLGQLENGKEALAHYSRGVEILSKQLAEAQALGASGDQLESKATGRELASAYCALAELYMSDLCFEPDAESRCDTLLSLADQACPDNPQVLQMQASVRLSQCRPQDAKPLILRAHTVIEGLMDCRDDVVDQKTGQDGDGMEEDEDSQQVSEMLSNMPPEELEALIPPYEFRAATCRILIECEEYEAASSLLERLLEENDEIAEVWLLLARCQMHLDAPEDAVECLEKGSELVEKLQKFDPSLSSDQQFLSMVEQFRSSLAEARQKAAGSEGQTPPLAPTSAS